ncbi:hypothetical protein [Haloglomus salinum]|uniref:hypothetical protein n=1 Tax=Haloglomus salinum TaxID=2962673 RepID=UPI0020C9EC9C|nr:hypothetical protein [Haloglomus salinum]
MTEISARARKVPVSRIPIDENSAFHQLYEDIMHEMFENRLFDDDPNLSRIRLSDWDEAPEIDDTELLKFIEPEKVDSPESEDERRHTDTKKKYDELSDKRQRMWKKIEQEYGYGPNADVFTVPEVHDKFGFRKGTIRNYVRDDFCKEMEIVAELDEASQPNGSKSWKLLESHKTELVSDGGYKWHYEWESIESGLEKEEIVDPDVDWFADYNFDVWVEIVRQASTIDDQLVKVARIQRDSLDQPDDYQDWRVNALKELREELQVLEGAFDQLFSALNRLLNAAYSSVVNWAAVHKTNNKTTSHDRYDPSVRLERTKLRAKAKHVALRSYYEPMINFVPEHNTTELACHEQADRAHELKQEVGEFLTWVYECSLDLMAFADTDMSTGGSTPLEDEIEQILFDEWTGTISNPSDYSLPWRQFCKIVDQAMASVDPSASEIYQAVRNVHLRGRSENNDTDYYGVHLVGPKQADQWGIHLVRQSDFFSENTTPPVEKDNLAVELESEAVEVL